MAFAASSHPSPLPFFDSRRGTESHHHNLDGRKRIQPEYVYEANREMMASSSHHRALLSETDPSSNLGLSAITIYSLEDERFCYVSESFRDILGYETAEIVGQRMDMLWHPDEYALTRQMRDHAISVEQTACVAYVRLKHKRGGYVNICSSFSIAYDMIVGKLTLAENGPMTLQQARTAKAVFEITPSASGGLSHRTWPMALSKSRSASPGESRSPPLLPLDTNATWDPPAERTPRTIFILDRFTDTATVHFSSNDTIVKGCTLPTHSFYSIVRPSHRPEVRRWIDAAKNWSPVQKSAARSGGHGFTTFDMLKIPDLPPRGDRFPRGTDENERLMPGQEFIAVEAVITASSDGVVCVIERLRPRPQGSTERTSSDRSLLHPPGPIHTPTRGHSASSLTSLLVSPEGSTSAKSEPRI